MERGWLRYGHLREITPECAYEELKKENTGSGRPEGATVGTQVRREGAGREEGGAAPFMSGPRQGEVQDGRILF